MKKGFTLAEVLITLGIIGVVSAMTIPSLQANIRRKELRTKFFKTYSTVQQVFKKMEAEDVPLDNTIYGSNNGKYFYSEFAKFVKTSQVCFRSSLKFPCYDYTSVGRYKNLTGTASISNNYFDDGQVILLDGTLLLFESPAAGSNVIIFTDLNGYNNQPNRLGYDLFAFQFVNGQLLPMGATGTAVTGTNNCNKSSNGNLNGMSCAYYALNDKNYFNNIDKP